MTKPSNSSDFVTALRVSQWLPGWDNIRFDAKNLRAKPEPYFYIFTMSAVRLKRLTGVDPRRALRGVSKPDEGVQRTLDSDRSREIQRYVDRGYPWSELSGDAQYQEEHRGLQKPGWLPSAIVLNILTPQDERRGRKVHSEDLIKVEESEQGPVIHLPHGVNDDWEPHNLAPLEVIDGQHRLWAFDKQNEEQYKNFQLPVVAFYGLDTSWRAYLFWTINIQPKRINPSLAFDLYPLLRNEDWLEHKFGHSIYKEARAQDIVEFLWSHQSSPWSGRINMLADKNKPGFVKQSAWVGALLTTFLRPWESGQLKIGGLYGASRRSSEPILPWSRSQQIAFLIFAGRCLAEAIHDCQDDWALQIRKSETESLIADIEDAAFTSNVAFTSKMSLLNADQGVRSFLSTVNDLCSMHAKELKLENWNDSHPAEPSPEYIDNFIREVEEEPVASFLKALARLLSHFDWRSFQYVPDDTPMKRVKASYRGSGGYKLFRLDLLEFLSQQESSDTDEQAVSLVARRVLSVVTQ